SKIQVIQVGGNTGGPPTLQFTPQSPTVLPGTLVTFQFNQSQSNHNVRRSSYFDPCQPLEGGFSTGFVSSPGEWSMMINDNTRRPKELWPVALLINHTAIWFFCEQTIPTPHCNAGRSNKRNINPFIV
ncbi:hypothetical protein BDZ94DRAFT_1173280, partial [Collybia nuda]